MFKIDDATAAAVLPTPAAAGTAGYFTEGDPGGSVPATVVTADWLNAVQEEIAYTITQTGGTLSKTDRTQLYTAISTFVAPDASETVKGKIEIATQAEALAGMDDERAMTSLKVTKLFTDTGRQSLAASGYQYLPGGLLMQWGSVSSASSGSSFVNTSVTFPVAFSTAAYSLTVSGDNLASNDRVGYSSLTTSGFTANVSDTAGGTVQAATITYIVIGK